MNLRSYRNKWYACPIIQWSQDLHLYNNLQVPQLQVFLIWNESHSLALHVTLIYDGWNVYSGGRRDNEQGFFALSYRGYSQDFGLTCCVPHCNTNQQSEKKNSIPYSHYFIMVFTILGVWMKAPVSVSFFALCVT